MLRQYFTFLSCIDTRWLCTLQLAKEAYYKEFGQMWAVTFNQYHSQEKCFQAYRCEPDNFIPETAFGTYSLKEAIRKFTLATVVKEQR